MKSKYLYTAAGVLGISAMVLFLSSNNADAYWQRGEGFRRNIERGIIDAKLQRNYQQTIDKFCANNDYEGWKAFKGEAPIAQYVNSGNFSRFCEMHQLRKEGKFLEADKIRQELGISWPRRSGQGSHCNR